MTKREIPLFLFDCGREHNLGEADFVACTDIDNAFVAKIDYVSGYNEIATDTTRITRSNNGVQLRLDIKRVTGKNPEPAKMRTLLKKAEDLYVEQTQRPVNLKDPSADDMLNFLNALIDGNKGQLSDIKDIGERQMAMVSLSMLDAIKNFIKRNSNK